jgi:hypothetical protein
MNPADYSTLGTSLAIAAYGIYQYVKREKEHRAVLQTLCKSDIPHSFAAAGAIKHAPWRLMAFALGEVILIAYLVWMFSKIPDPTGVGKAMGFVVTAYMMLALPGVLGILKRALWHLLTLCFIEVVLVGAVIWLISVRSKIIYAGEVTYFIAFFFGVLFFVLLPIVVRDVRAYHNN